MTVGTVETLILGTEQDDTEWGGRRGWGDSGDCGDPHTGDRARGLCEWGGRGGWGVTVGTTKRFRGRRMQRRMEGGGGGGLLFAFGPAVSGMLYKRTIKVHCYC